MHASLVVEWAVQAGVGKCYPFPLPLLLAMMPPERIDGTVHRRKRKKAIVLTTKSHPVPPGMFIKPPYSMGYMAIACNAALVASGPPMNLGIYTNIHTQIPPPTAIRPADWLVTGDGSELVEPTAPRDCRCHQRKNMTEMDSRASMLAAPLQVRVAAPPRPPSVLDDDDVWTSVESPGANMTPILLTAAMLTSDCWSSGLLSASHEARSADDEMLLVTEMGRSKMV